MNYKEIRGTVVTIHNCMLANSTVLLADTQLTSECLKIKPSGTISRSECRKRVSSAL